MNLKKTYKIISTSFVERKINILYSFCISILITVFLFLIIPKFNRVEIVFLPSNIVNINTLNKLKADSKNKLKADSNLSNLITDLDKKNINENSTIEIIARSIVQEYIFNNQIKKQTEIEKNNLLAYIFANFLEFKKKMYNNGIEVEVEGLQPSFAINNKNEYVKFIFSKKFFFPNEQKNKIINKDFVFNELKSLIVGFNLHSNDSYKLEILDWYFYVQVANFNTKNHFYKLFSAIIFLTILIHSLISLLLNKKKFKVDRRSK